MKLRISSRARNALTLVARRYNIGREEIVEIAPLLLFIAAEQSLIERKKHVDEVSASADELLDLQSGIRHLPVASPLDYEALDGEKKSIRARDLFGETALEDVGVIAADFEYDEAEDNPFVTYLRDSLAKVSNSPEVAKSVSWWPGFGPSYEICTEEASSIVGGDTKAARAIVSGDAALHEMPKAYSPEQRAEWARGRELKELNIEDIEDRAQESQSPDTGEVS
jgi:hypothetical protein